MKSIDLRTESQLNQMTLDQRLDYGDELAGAIEGITANKLKPATRTETLAMMNLSLKIVQRNNGDLIKAGGSLEQIDRGQNAEERVKASIRRFIEDSPASLN